LSLSWFVVKRSLEVAPAQYKGACIIGSGLYRRSRRDAINYPLSGAMSREN
jgi:hypothetical protein